MHSEQEALKKTDDIIVCYVTVPIDTNIQSKIDIEENIIMTIILVTL